MSHPRLIHTQELDNESCLLVAMVIQEFYGHCNGANLAKYYQHVLVDILSVYMYPLVSKKGAVHRFKLKDIVADGDALAAVSIHLFVHFVPTHTCIR